ncbi:MAG: DUF2079 domain-containing protein [Actinomycetota bacterium]
MTALREPTREETQLEFGDLDLPTVVLLTAIFVWVGWFGWLALGRYSAFSFGAFDLGIFDQGAWLISRGDLSPFITLRGLPLFADHSSYLLFLVAPIYLVWADPRVLVLLAVLAPAAAVWLAYRIGIAEGLRPWVAATIGLALLLHPAVAWTPWDAFHPETLTIPLLPASYLAARKGRFTLAVILGVLVLLAKEDAFLVVMPLAAYFWWRWPENRRAAWWLGMSAVAIAAVNLLVVLPGLSPTGELIYSGRLDGPWTSRLTMSRLSYLAVVLVPAATSLAAPRLLAVAGPATFLNLWSSFPYQHEIRWHYTAYLLGVLAMAAPVGMKRLGDRFGDRLGVGFVSEKGAVGKRLHLAVLIVVAAIGTLHLAGPDLTAKGVWAGQPADESAAMSEALSVIPDDAVVAASYLLAPHLAHRSNIYMLPNPWEEDIWGVNDTEPPPHDPSNVEWVAVQNEHAGEEVQQIRDDLLASGWEVVATGDTVDVLTRSPG